MVDVWAVSVIDMVFDWVDGADWVCWSEIDAVAAPLTVAWAEYVAVLVELFDTLALIV